MRRKAIWGGGGEVLECFMEGAEHSRGEEHPQYFNPQYFIDHPQEYPPRGTPNIS